jgi:hypothetical protein
MRRPSLLTASRYGAAGGGALAVLVAAERRTASPMIE